MAVGLAIPPQNSERNMPEGTLGFKLNRVEFGTRDREGFFLSLFPKIPYWLATVTPRRFWDQHPSEASGHSGRSLPYEMTVTRSGETPSAVR